MKRTRAQQPKATEPQDPAAADAAGNPTKPQRRAKQPRQPKGAKKPGAAAARIEGAAAVAAVANNAAAASVASSAPETAPTVPDVCGAGEAGGAAGCQASMDWDLDAGLGGGAWWTWGVDEEKLLGWFPFVEEDFRCLAGRAADAEAAFDDDIWRIHQIYEIPNYAAK